MNVLRTLLVLLALAVHTFAQRKDDFNIVDFGAKADGNTVNTLSIQKAIDLCSKSGGGTVYVPKGVFLTGTLVLKSNVTLELARQAILKGTGNLADYPQNKVKAVSRVNNVLGSTNRAFIIAEDVENIGIIGEGKIDPFGNHPNYKFAQAENKDQIFACWIISARNVAIRDVQFDNSSYWNLRLLFCDFVKIRGIKIFNHGNFNSDGIDIDGCRNVTLSDCIVDASDDAICLKSEGDRATENVVISNCIVSSHASAIKLGTASIKGFRNILVSNCVIKPSESKEMKHVANAWGGLVGIDLDQVDGGLMENVSFQHIVIDSVETPIFAKLGERNHSANTPGWSPKKGAMRNISFSHISIKNAGPIACNITGYPGNDIEYVSLDHIHIHTRGGGTDRDTSFYVSEESRSYPVSRMFASNLPAYGFFFRHVQHLYMHDLVVDYTGTEVRSGMVLDDVKNARLRDVRLLKSSSLGLADVQMQRCRAVEVWTGVWDNKSKNYLRVRDTSGSIYLNGQLATYAPMALSKKIQTVAKLPALDSALVAYWSFDEGKGSTVKDLTGKTGNGTVNGAVWSKGIKGTGLLFTGQSHVDFGTEAFTKVNPDMTFAFWMKLSNPNSQNYYRVFCKRKSWDSDKGFELEMIPGANRFNFSGAYDYRTNDMGNVEVKFDTAWHHYTAVLTDRRLRVYVDGYLVAADERVASPSEAVGVPFIIGANAALNDRFEGQLDEVKIWLRALDAKEIRLLK